MNKLVSTLCLVVLMNHGSAIACSTNETPCSIKKDRWLGYIAKALPDGFCEKDSALMQCYEMSQKRCLELSTKLTKQCLNASASRIPETLNKADSEKWGAEVGSCAGDKLTNIVKLKKGKNADCGT